MDLHRKYRPSTLKRIVGNAGAVGIIEKFKAQGSFPQAIMLIGPAGTGKTTLARIIAKELECNELDFAELDSADYGGIADIRAIRRKMAFKPRLGPVRVYFLDEAHKLTADAQEALLKGLEEPPKHVHFILATTDPQLLKPTIRSRCSVIETELLSSEEIGRDLLMPVCRAEKVEVPKPILKHIARECMGASRTALVMLASVIGLPEDKMEAAISAIEDEQADLRALCQLLLKKAPWKEVAAQLGKMRKSPHESIRFGVLGYMSSVMLGGGGNGHARWVSLCFSETMMYSKFNGLVAAAYDSIHTEA